MRAADSAARLLFSFSFLSCCCAAAAIRYAIISMPRDAMRALMLLPAPVRADTSDARYAMR